jgi:hypothetical protein
LGAGAGPSGGGFAQPLYQQGLSIPSAPAGVRYVPDVSILASPDFPGYIFCTAQSELVSGGSSTSSCAGGIASAINSYVSLVGGTSVSAPVFAGIVTLLNQAVVLSGLQSSPGLGNINGNLYYLAAHTPTAFHQVNVGDNMVYCQPTLPTGFPSNVVCPAAGVFGYLASNKDTAEGTGYNLVTGLGSVDANNFVTAWADLVASSISILATPSTVIAGQTVTLTGTVTPATATGQVTFTTTVSGSTTTVGTASLSSGVATLSATNLPVGANSLNASYAGDSSDLPSSTTAAATVTVTAPTFNVSNPTTPSPAPAGTSTTSTFTVTPTGAATVSAITFACNGLPDATITCAFNPTQIPIGASSAVPVTLTITTSGPNPSGAVNNGRRRADNRSPWLPLTLPLAGIVIFGFAGRKLSRCSVILGLSFSLVLLGLLVACGGGSSAPAVGISVSPTAATVFANGPSGSTWPPQTASFTATVTNSTNMGVTWSISPTAAGSISSGGVYTAPTVAEGLPKTATVTATSQADSTKTASATVTITPTSVPGPYSITVTATEGPTQNTTAPFTLTVQ